MYSRMDRQYAGTPVFVFGSNLHGIHGAGAALCARVHHGAIQGQGRGRMGNSYALPTKASPHETLPIDHIRINVIDFLVHAEQHPDTEFLLTKVGTGLAGIDEMTMARMFVTAPHNVRLINNKGERVCLAKDWIRHIASARPGPGA